MNNSIIEIKDKETCYFLSPYGLGDTLILASLKDELEKFYNLKIHFLIKNTHKIIMDMYNIESYTTIEMPSIEELKKIIIDNKIKKGSIFIAHPLFVKDDTHINNFNCGKVSFYEMYLSFLGLPINTKFNNKIVEKNEGLSELIIKLQQNNINDLDNVILLAPEADSCPLINQCYWEKIIKKYSSMGYYVILNAKNKKNTIRGAKFLPLTIEEALLIAQNCAGIISLRSGFCDLVALKHKGFLKVLYPNIDVLNLYSIKRSFSFKNIEEQLVNLYKYNCYVYLFGLKMFQLFKFKHFNKFSLNVKDKTILNN